jgi:hypothetical protein
LLLARSPVKSVNLYLATRRHTPKNIKEKAKRWKKLSEFKSYELTSSLDGGRSRSRFGRLIPSGEAVGSNPSNLKCTTPTQVLLLNTTHHRFAILRVWASAPVRMTNDTCQGLLRLCEPTGTNGPSSALNGISSYHTQCFANGISNPVHSPVSLQSGFNFVDLHKGTDKTNCWNITDFWDKITPCSLADGDKCFGEYAAFISRAEDITKASHLVNISNDRKTAFQPRLDSKSYNQVV